jgi:hypothetical protein
MRNDHLGKADHNICGHTVRTFYASGNGGKEVRADGKGSYLRRGYYASHDVRGGQFGLFKTIGPFNNRNDALRAGVDSLNQHVNG